MRGRVPGCGADMRLTPTSISIFEATSFDITRPRTEAGPEGNVPRYNRADGNHANRGAEREGPPCDAALTPVMGFAGL